MKNKKEKLVVILLVVVLIVATVAISYAAFRYTATGSILNQITTGSITMSYTESSNVISMTGALPTTDATGKVRLNEGEYFDFTVGSSITGTANINYEIAAQELDGNTIEGSYIKYYLTKVNEDNSEEEVMSPKTYTEETTSNEYTGRPSNMMSLYEGSMNASTTTKYRLRLYVDESYNPQGDGGNLIYKVRINVYGLSGDEIEETLAPGLYAEDGTMTMSWQELLSTEITYLIETDEFDDEGNVITKEIKSSILNIDENGILTSHPDELNGKNFSSDYLNGKLVISSDVKIIDGFQYCENLTSVIVPDSVTNINEAAFFNCTNLKYVEIGDGVEILRYNVFADLNSLETVMLSKNVKKIQYYAFGGIKQPISINYEGTQKQWNLIEFADLWNDYSQEITVHCTDGDIVFPAFN